MDDFTIYEDEEGDFQVIIPSEGDISITLASVGVDGAPGVNGKSAYELAVEEGFEGTLEEWLAQGGGSGGVEVGVMYDLVGAMFQTNDSINWTFDTTFNTITADVSAEFIYDTVAGILAQGANVTLTEDDTTNTITIASTGGGGGGGGTAAEITFDPTGTSLEATNVQDAIEEIELLAPPPQEAQLADTDSIEWNFDDPSDTITGDVKPTFIYDRLVEMLLAGTAISLIPNAIDETITLNVTGGGGGASALNDLTDVISTSPQVGDALIYDGVNWVNRTQVDELTLYVGPDGVAAPPNPLSVTPADREFDSINNALGWVEDNIFTPVALTIEVSADLSYLLSGGANIPRQVVVLEIIGDDDTTTKITYSEGNGQVLFEPLHTCRIIIRDIEFVSSNLTQYFARGDNLDVEFDDAIVTDFFSGFYADTAGRLYIDGLILRRTALLSTGSSLPVGIFMNNNTFGFATNLTLTNYGNTNVATPTGGSAVNHGGIVCRGGSELNLGSGINVTNCAPCMSSDSSSRINSTSGFTVSRATGYEPCVVAKNLGEIFALGGSAVTGALRVSTRGRIHINNISGGAPTYQYDTASATVNVQNADGSVVTNSSYVAPVVPSGGSTGQVLKKLSGTNYDYSWQADSGGSGSGTGDVVGPASAVDDRIATFDGVSGKLIQDGGSTIANVLARANHTGTQASTTISDFAEAVDDRVDALIADSGRITWTYNDASNTLTPDIPNDAINYGRIQNVSATDRILGRATAGAGDIEEITCTAFSRTLLDDADQATWQATLGLTPGTDVQAFDADLSAVAGLSTTGLIERTGSGTATTRAIGVATSASIPSRADADTRYALASHTHTSGNITDFAEAVDDRVDTLIQDSTSITWTYNDSSNTLTPAVSDEYIYDTIAGMIAAGTNVTVTPNDTTNTLTIAASGGGGGTDDQTAAEVPFTPAGNLAATNVQAALEELDTEKQPLDATLTDLAAEVPVAGGFIYFPLNSTKQVSQLNSSADGRAILGATYATMRTNLGLVVGTNVQAQDATLQALSGLDTTTGLVEQTGTDTFAKRALGVGASTSIPTRDDADTRYAALSHTHTTANITDFTEAVDDRVDALMVDTATVAWTYTDASGTLEASVPDDAVTDAKLRNSAALSVIGRSANSTGDPADIAAASDGDVLRRSGTSIGFGTILAASVSDFTEAAQDAVGAMASTGIVYVDATPALSVDKATDANVRAAASNKVLTADLVESASAIVTLTDAATIAIDWDTFIVGRVTLGGNRTLGNPTNGQPGTFRTILVKQNAGSNTLTLDTQYDDGDATLILSTAAGKEDVLSILCVATDKFYVFIAKGFTAP